MRWQITYVEPVLLIFLFCLFLRGPIGQQMVLKKVCLKHFNSTYCDSMSGNKTNENEENMIQEEAAKWNVYISVSNTLPALITTFIYGPLSDVVGRKKILVIPIVGEIINNIFYLLNAWYFSSALHYLVIGNAISGLCGNFGTILMCANAYVADTSRKDARTKRVIILNAMLFIGSTFSFIGGGLILHKFGFAAVYFTILAFFALLMIYLCFLKESYQLAGEFKVTASMFVKKLLDVFKVILKKREEYYRMRIFLFFVCFSMLLWVTLGFGEITVLFLKHEPLNFDSVWIGYFAAEINVARIIGATFFTIIFVHKYKWSDSSLIIITSIAVGASMLCLSFASNLWQVFAAGIWWLGVCSGTAATQAGLSKMVSEAEQGKICSFIGNIQVLCTLISSAIFPTIYKNTVHITPSLVLYILACLSMIPLLCSLILKVLERRLSHYKVMIDDGDQEVSTDQSKK